MPNDNAADCKSASITPGQQPQLDIKVMDRVYNLIRLDNKTYFKLRKNVIFIEDDYEQLDDLADDEELIYSNMAKMYVALKTRFGESGTSYDDWKGSFGFAFLLSFAHDGKEMEYMLNIYNLRSSIEFRLFKLPGADEQNIDRHIYHQPFPDFPRPAIRSVFNYIVGFLSGYFETMEKWYDEPFFQTVASNLIVFGFKDGQFFDEQYEDQEDFEAVVKELKAASDAAMNKSPLANKLVCNNRSGVGTAKTACAD